MRIVIQRVREASVEVNSELVSSVNKGLLIFLGIETDDDKKDADWLTAKIAGLRIFEDENNLMNFSVKDIKGEILLISQFTLMASSRKGNRPSFIRAARPEMAVPLYEYFIQVLENQFNIPTKTGVFGADMKVKLLNDGPVTIIIDSKLKE